MGYKYYLKNLFWNLYGRTIHNPGLPLDIRSILFICLGNICRSPFAEEIARKRYRSSNIDVFRSAGIRAPSPRIPPTEAVETAKKFGINLENHRSRQLNYEMLESYDLIVVMEAWQLKFLRRIFVEYRDKIFLLPSFDKNGRKSFDSYSLYNIRDPYDRSLSEYDHCFRRIETSLDFLFQEIGKI